MKNAITYTLIFSLLTLFSLFVVANDRLNEYYPNNLNRCEVTKFESNDYEPESFQTTNNLLRLPGNEPVYCGQKIIIKGVLLDQKCVPVQDAKIYLWQVNCNGKYPYKPLRSRVKKNMIAVSTGSTFQGSGIATTNNKGEFYFITIMPPVIHDSKMPYVNVRVESRKLGKTQTKLFFSSEKLNNSSEIIDPMLSNISDIPIYDFKIVISGEGLKNY